MTVKKAQLMKAVSRVAQPMWGALSGNNVRRVDQVLNGGGGRIGIAQQLQELRNPMGPMLPGATMDPTAIANESYRLSKHKAALQNQLRNAELAAAGSRIGAGALGAYGIHQMMQPKEAAYREGFESACRQRGAK